MQGPNVTLKLTYATYQAWTSGGEMRNQHDTQRMDATQPISPLYGWDTRGGRWRESASEIAEARLRHLIDHTCLSPDCVKRDATVMVNEMFPPPTIRVKVGDLVTLTLVNLLLSIAVTVHIHGARSELS